MSEKTQEPTEQRRRKAREDGNIPKSKMLSAAGVTLGGLVATLAFAQDSAARLIGFTQRLLSLGATTPEAELVEGVRLLAICLAPTLAGALLGALAAGVPQAGIQLNLTLVQPKLENLDPSKGIKKVASPRQAVDLLKGLAVAFVVAIILWNGVRAAAPAVLKALHHEPVTAFHVLFASLFPTVLKASAVLLVLGIGDYALARLRHTKDLMMSHDEVKQEHKNSEGDPHTKGKRKQLMKQLAMGGPARGVKEATAVVVNPTHIAVALRYDEAECDAPYIVARGREEDALALRRAAKDLGIPVVRDVPLARSLVHFDVGEQVPEELYQAAAAVLRVALEAAEEASSERPDAAVLVKETP